jgi:tetratricopeptide (TPR) repeat protein
MSLASALPPLVAYRTDLTALGTPTLGDAESQWLTVAVQLEQLSRVMSSERELVLDAIRELVDDAAGATPDVDSLSSAMRRLTSTIEDAGALHLAHSLIARWSALDDLSILERGRTWAIRARILRQLDAREQAKDLYLDVETLGRRHDAPELLARANIGLAVLAQLRGNYPEMRRLTEEALTYATQAGERLLMFQARMGLLTVEAHASHFDVALEHAWEAFELARDDDALAAEALLDLSQLLADLGYPRAALAGYAAALERRPPLRIEMPALGGAAIAAARVSNPNLLNAVSRRADHLDRTNEGFAYIRVAALLELAIAHDIAHLRVTAEHYRARVQSLATARGFHELAMQAENLASHWKSSSRPSAPERSPLNAASADIVEYVEGLADPQALLAMT